MLEVRASLPSRSVFLAGEIIECIVTFTNVGRGGHRTTSSPSRNKHAKLAWASAQIHCQCSVSESRVALPKSPLLTSSEVSTTANETSFVPFRGEKGSTVLSTKPSILFCDLTLAVGESKTFTYRETIPLEAPPSFRGTAIKYSYKISIGAQRLNCPTKLLRVPFRVLVVPGLNDVSVYTEPEPLSPSNPFQLPTQKESTLLEIALEVLQTITCRKGPSYYNISNSGGKVAKFCLFKQAYRIGDDIVGTCDFTEGFVPCVQFSITLQSDEQIAEECQRRPGQVGTITSYSKHHEFCLHTNRTHVSIPIPLTATPGFITDLVCLRWRLHFEFVTCKDEASVVLPPEDSEPGSIWHGPDQLKVETMVWDLPIKVFATNPLHASSVSLLKSETTCNI